MATPILVLDKQKKGETHRGYHWVYYSPEKKLVLFDYQPDRSREGPTKLLKDYQGYLQTDGYQAYEAFEQQECPGGLHGPCPKKVRTSLEE